VAKTFVGIQILYPLLLFFKGTRIDVMSFPLKVLKDLRAFLQHFKHLSCSSHDEGGDKLSEPEPGGPGNQQAGGGLKAKEATTRSAYSAVLLRIDTAIACGVKVFKITYLWINAHLLTLAIDSCAKW
jgi:hypothetical protein